jgi:thioredoxin reductase (NADPH)
VCSSDLASTAATVVDIERSRLAAIMAKNAAFSARVAGGVAAARDRFVSQRDPTQHAVQDFFLRYGFATSSVVRVSQVDKCLDCNKCQDACAARHGIARVNRDGLRLGSLAFPLSCRTCRDHPCVPACGFGAISLDEETSEIRISDRCSGCGGCAQACPNGAIFLVQVPYKAADFPEPIPASGPSGTTNVAQLFVAGDVSGAALIRFAMNEAVRAVDNFPPRRFARADNDVYDAIIVGAGPAGIAAALRCNERGLRSVVLEKDRAFSTIEAYPKNKHVMAEPRTVPLQSSLWFDDSTKEELLARWRETVARERLQIVEGAEVLRISRRGEIFDVETARGPAAAENVVVCIGNRGSPRKLGVPGETPSRVRYTLPDPDEFAGQQVLVVGGGDSAVEAALSLADVAGTEVTLSYRKGAFARTKTVNRERIFSYEASGRVRLELKSTVTRLESGHLILRTEAGEQRLENDVVFAFLGADPPTGFLRQAGIQVLEPGSAEMAKYAAGRGLRQRAVKCDHCVGFGDRACLTACPTNALVEIRPQDLFMETDAAHGAGPRRFSANSFIDGLKPRKSPLVRFGLGATGWLIALALVAIGVECFLRKMLPDQSAFAHYLRHVGRAGTVTFGPGKGFGHWLGYIGTGFMLSTLAYSLRARVKWLRGLGQQATWLTLHLWAGIIGASLVTFHSTLKMDRWVSIACVAMWFIVLTGAIGRYLFGRVHASIGTSDFVTRALERGHSHVADLRRRSRAVRALTGPEGTNGHRASGIVVVMLWEELRDRVALVWLRFFGLSEIGDRQTRQDLLVLFADWARHRRARSYLEAAKTMFRYWNWTHVILTFVMFGLAAVHIWYGFMYKAV